MNNINKSLDGFNRINNPYILGNIEPLGLSNIGSGINPFETGFLTIFSVKTLP